MQYDYEDGWIVYYNHSALGTRIAIGVIRGLFSKEWARHHASELYKSALDSADETYSVEPCTIWTPKEGGEQQ